MVAGSASCRRRIAKDWVAGLRTADPAIDARISACLAKVGTVERYLPVEAEAEFGALARL